MLIEGDFYLGIATRRACVDRINDSLNVRAKLRLLLLAEDHDRDLSAREILLITHVLVRCQQ